MAHTAPAHNVHMGAKDSRSGEGGREHMGASSSLQPHACCGKHFGGSVSHTRSTVFSPRQFLGC